MRKSQPRPCQSCKAVVGGRACHQHGGKWLRQTGSVAKGTRRDVYRCGAAGCTSEVAKCSNCGLLHAARDDNDYLENLRKCKQATQPLPAPCPCDSCGGQVLLGCARDAYTFRVFLGAPTHAATPSPPPPHLSDATRASSAGRGAGSAVSAVRFCCTRWTDSPPARRRLRGRQQQGVATVGVRPPCVHGSSC